MKIDLVNPTRLGNGHYCSQDGNEYMSIWTYNKKFNTSMNTYNAATDLRQERVPYIEVPTETNTPYKTVLGFRVEDIHDYVDLMGA